MSDLVVAVFVTDGEPASTIESIHASAEQAGARVDPVVVSTTTSQAPAVPGATDVLQFFPLGRGYAKSRLLEAGAPAVAFLDDTVCVESGWVEAVLDALAQPTTAAVVGPVRPYDSDTTRSAAVALAVRALRGAAQPSNTAVVCDRALAIGGYSIRLEPVGAPYEDLALVADLRRRGWEVQWLPAATVNCMDMEHDRRPVDSTSIRGYEIGRAIRRSRGRLAGPCAAAALVAPRLASPRMVPGLLRGLRRAKPWVSPPAFLHRLPASISQRIHSQIKPLPASPPPKTHLMYDVGGRMLLHLHVAPSARLKRALAEREQIRRRTGGIAGIPRLHASQFESDAAWILEDRLPGTQPEPGEFERWFPQVARWAIELAGPPGPKLGTIPEWQEHCAELVARIPAHEEFLLRSFSALDELPSRHMHGDCQRRNLLLSDSSIGLVDWEGAWLHGIPGLDLVFLAILGRSDRPERAVLAALLAEGDPEPAPLVSFLDRAGAPRAALRPLLVAMLATWALGEERRIRRSRAHPHSRPFRELLDEFIPKVAA